MWWLNVRLDISQTVLHLNWHEHFAEIRYNLTDAQKRLNWKSWKKSIEELQNLYIRSLQMTKFEYIRMNQKVTHSNVWMFQTNSSSTKVIRLQSTPKIACFFGYTLYVAILLLKNRRTLNTKWHSTIRCINQIRKNNRKCCIILKNHKHIKQLIIRIRKTEIISHC